MDNEKAVIAVIVTYNRKMLLQESMNALFTQSQDNFDLMVIDNMSSDGTEEMMKRYLSDKSIKNHKIIYHRLKQNLGGAGGFYHGVKEAVKLGYQYIWIMDDDTIPATTALAELLSSAELLQNQFGYLSSTAVWLDNNICSMNTHKLKDRLAKDEYSHVQKGIIPVKSATFVSLFLKREAIEKLGLPLKEYFIWGDDKEYTFRISKQYPCYWVSKSIVIHKMKSNNGSNIITDEVARIQRYQYAYRNDLATARKISWKEVVSYYYYFFKTIIQILHSAPSYKLWRIFTMFRGMFEGILFCPKPEYVQHET